MESSTLTMDVHEPDRKKKKNKYKILSAVLFVALVVMSLGLGLGLGLRKTEEPALVTCRSRCYDTSSGRNSDCQCDAQCITQGNCCFDYDDLCQKSKEEWTCSRVRCAEKRILGSICSCSNDCLTQGDCCTNYKEVCEGGTPWAVDQCETSTNPQCPADFDIPPVIIFSLDGFRADYLQTWSFLTPNIEKLKKCGTHSKYMRAVYPTKTFPNHYSIVTGLFPESNGIIDNNMYDINMNKIFTLSSNEKFNESWWEGQPIWLTAMYQGRKAGTFFWPGSDVPINGSYPNLYELFNSSVIYEQRVSRVLKWLDLPKSQRPDFYTLYIEEPDSSGHSYGPVSGGVIAALLLADKTVGMLLDGLKQRNLHNCVNLIVVADHGMEKTYCEKLELMTDYFETINFWLYDGPAARLRAFTVPRDYYSFDSLGIVQNLTCRKSDQHFKPYMTYDLPKRFHYANNIRIDKVHLYVDRQWLVGRDHTFSFCGGGNHGYDNEFKSMEAIFLGHGPGFKRGVEVEPFDNIELYNLMCDLLKIQPAPNNGTHGSLNHLLVEPFYIPTHPSEKSNPSTCPFLPSISTLNCSCNTSVGEETLNERLNLNSANLNQSETTHLPYGRPRNVEENSTYCVLYQESYVTGYSHDILMPLWSAYTITKHGTASPLPPTLEECLRPDPRIPEAKSQKCSDYKPEMNITRGFLHPPIFNSEIEQYDSLITSNIVPMYEEFKRIWDYLHNILLLQFASERNGLNVVSGPVFDYNYDGHADSNITKHVEDTEIPIPTHYFVVMTSCNDTNSAPSNCSTNLKVLSFIIPHRPDNTESCAGNRPESEWVKERLQVHAARVRDVELLTGLDFYQGRNQPVSEILQVKTFSPSFETDEN
uniref:Ectonucleotide pyrophosphatase/phosphodiesterase 3 n=1 Tax=Leptobrachium leishanense TaxID=445787 RepID=A0A8C5MIK6_9ANUR